MHTDLKQNKMALRSKKDIKKSSYYVWFLGAQESRGLRGEEYALPAIEHLERRSKDLEPFKVTLQVSHKGLKIVQNVAPKGKQQTIKHFIPHGSITSAVVQGDVVACVLLLFNPVTRCPIHVHAYRCDSDDTAEMLCTHLQALIDRPENQKKFADIERKLQMKGALPQANKKVPDSSLGSEVSTRESESGSSEERCVATLYDSLAAELKQKLSTGKSPILLPPRDYDTVHRQKGNLSGIETRRCLNQSIVGVNARRKLESSGGSSGIGSDLAPSPDRNEYSRQHDNQSTSEEDWAESTAYLMHEGFDVTPPQRGLSPRREINHPSKYPEERMYRQESSERPTKYAEDFAYQRRYTQRQQSPLPAEQLRNSNRNSVSIERVRKEMTKFEKIPTKNQESRQNGYGSNAPKLTRGMSEGSLKLADGSISPKDRFNVAKEKFMNLERERFNQELEKHMRIRRSMLEKNQRASSPEEFKNKRESRKWSQEEDEDEVVLERRAELPRVGQRYPSRDNGQNGVDKRFYEYGAEEYYDQRRPADRRRPAVEDVDDERYFNGNRFADTNNDYRQSRRFESSENRRSRGNELDRRVEEDFEVRDTRIEPVIEDRKKRIVDPKRLSRIDAVRDDRDRYEARPAKAEQRRGPLEDEWSNQRRPVSRSRLLQEPNKRHSSYDAEVEARRTFEMRKSYAEVNNNGFSNSGRNYERYGPGIGPGLGAGREPQLRYREEEERRATDRYLAPGLDSAKLRHSYAEPMTRNRVGIAPVRPY